MSNQYCDSSGQFIMPGNGKWAADGTRLHKSEAACRKALERCDHGAKLGAKYKWQLAKNAPAPGGLQDATV